MAKARSIDLVTGASSAIGKEIVNALLKKGDEVRVLVKRYPEAMADTLSLPSGVKPYAADIALVSEKDKKTLREACKNVDRIFHLAGATYNNLFSFDQMITTNVAGTENLIQSYLDTNPSEKSNVHIFYSSTTSIYGYRRKGEILTEESLPKPASNYAETKLMAEQVIKSFAESSNRIRYTILRFATFYGKGYEKSFFKVFKLIKEGKMIYIGDGKNHLVFVNTQDALKAVLLSIASKRAQNQTYNITDGRSYTIKSLFEFVASQLNVEPPKRSLPRIVARLGRKIAKVNYDEFEFLSSDRVISVQKARNDLGYKPLTNMEKEGKDLIRRFTSSYNK